MVISPITRSNNTEFESSISCSSIIEQYKAFKIDVSRYFQGLTEISIYKCLDTGYRFYYPLNIDGDSWFYEQLQKFDWYYMPWKWEHEQAESYLQTGMKILEVGCANGEFLKRVRSKVNEAVGLELNLQAVAAGQKDGLEILQESVQEHSRKHKGKYDLVCSFQVVEHISDVKSFLEASVELLKKDGTLIVSVPNNDSFLGLSTNCLNMPPHHMGLWNKGSLSSIVDIFRIELLRFHLEPLQPYHRTYFESAMTKHFLEKYRSLRPVLKWFLPKIVRSITPFFSDNLKAYTIQAVYRKK